MILYIQYIYENYTGFVVSCYHDNQLCNTFIDDNSYVYVCIYEKNKQIY